MTTEPSLPTPIERAAQAAGNAHRLAKQLGISHVAVGKWLHTGRVPAERVLTIERLTGVSRHDLRPDLYPNP
jgi:DNA-binding transcriptional regulator YdaS (Cro superfamily)